MIIEIRGVQFVNKGAELMLHAVVQKLKEIYPEALIALEPNINSPYTERVKLNALQKWSIQKSVLDLNWLAYLLPLSMRQWLVERWGIVTESDVDLVLDASGFAYGDQWSSTAITRLCNELKRSKRYGKKYVFLPQAFGPFSRDQDLRRLKNALPLASLICAREDTSYAHLENLVGGLPTLVKYPDFTNLVVGHRPSYYTGGNRKVLIVPNGNMVGERNKNQQWKARYVTVMAEAVAAIRERNLEPVLLNHEGGGDDKLCKEIRSRAGNSIDIIYEPDPLKVKGLIGASHALVCSRFHGCVSALSQGIPCIGTSWSHKYERLFEEYGVPQALITPKADKEAISQLLGECETMKDVIGIRGKAMKALSLEMWQCVKERLESSSDALGQSAII